MRWKLIILSSLIVSFVSASAWFVLANFIFHAPLFLNSNWLYLQIFVLILVITAVSTYIYRHTATRRKTQAFLTSILTIFFVFALLFGFNFIANSAF
ncbi:MAG: hypothetical protein ABI954_04115 [Pyrinomonadaceae bacterium]